MGLLTQLATLPLAPVRGVACVIERGVEIAENGHYEPAPSSGNSLTSSGALLTGDIDEETFDWTRSGANVRAPIPGRGSCRGDGAPPRAPAAAPGHPG
ncbi:gas vesicle protein GvpG [Streptomyces yanii]|uniref:Gas vesicle protein GvpG n=1 Tax=Streptomyces yanii TaxID=78510 RepID=A0ABV5RA94_9ACTN